MGRPGCNCCVSVQLRVTTYSTKESVPGKGWPMGWQQAHQPMDCRDNIALVHCSLSGCFVVLLDCCVFVQQK